MLAKGPDLTKKNTTAAAVNAMCLAEALADDAAEEAKSAIDKYFKQTGENKQSYLDKLAGETA